MLIVGLSGLRDFYPELIAENLRKQGHTARAAFLPLDLITERRDLNTAQLACALDEPSRRTRLGAELAKLVQAGERIGLPAVLGMDDHAGAMKDLHSATNADLFEIPTLPPSVPGIRLFAALQGQFQKLGGRVEVNMDVIGFHTQDQRVTWVETDASGRPLKHRADRFLLATGGILGGGLTTDHVGAVRDVVLNLPLATPRSRGEWFRARFLDPAGHPIFRAGIPVNRAFQPIDAAGARVYSNVFAAGGILAHADPILERSLEGIAIATGCAAGRSAAQSDNS
jgi:glycerol-3-phosphate dehydrogenase subunit B